MRQRNVGSGGEDAAILHQHCSVIDLLQRRNQRSWKRDRRRLGLRSRREANWGERACNESKIMVMEQSPSRTAT